MDEKKGTKKQNASRCSDDCDGGGKYYNDRFFCRGSRR